MVSLSNSERSRRLALPLSLSKGQGAGEHVAGATHFTSPMPKLAGLSYAFDYGNARFVLLDQFTRTDGTSYLGSTNNNVIDQLPWIGEALAAKPAGGHAFVFAHKGLITENHADTLFGANPAASPDARTPSSRASGTAARATSSAGTITCTTAPSS